jgi:hypothetical protein
MHELALGHDTRTGTGTGAPDDVLTAEPMGLRAQVAPPSVVSTDAGATSVAGDVPDVEKE